VVLRFADASAPWGFLNDPEYQPLKVIRLSVTSRGQADRWWSRPSSCRPN